MLGHRLFTFDHTPGLTATLHNSIGQGLGLLAHSDSIGFDAIGCHQGALGNLLSKTDTLGPDTVNAVSSLGGIGTHGFDLYRLLILSLHSHIR